MSRCLQKVNRHFDMKRFNHIIGSGGFGLIVKHDEEPIVAKLLYSAGCQTAEEEYFKHLAIFTAFQTVRNNRFPQICVANPLGYDSEKVDKFGKVFDCYYMMSLLDKIDNNGLYHIIRESMKSSVDKVIGRIYGETVSDVNPSRGFFASYSYITENILNDETLNKGNILTIDDILEYMGFSFGVIAFIAEYSPLDVEYTLGKTPDDKLCFSVLDFGMTTKIFFGDQETQKEIFATSVQKKKINEERIRQIIRVLVNGFEMDIYFPDEEEGKVSFLKGMKSSLQYVETHIEEKTLVFKKFSEEITQ
jgi:hypothetical protein